VCCVLFKRDVFLLCLIVVPVLPGKNLFADKIIIQFNSILIIYVPSQQL
jgi:hypothetical protein